MIYCERSDYTSQEGNMATKPIQTEIEITDIEFPCHGIGHYQGSKLKIKRTLPGQRVEIMLRKRGKHFRARPLCVLRKAQEECAPACPDFDVCGGCTFQNIPYEYELRLKEKMVLDLFHQAELTGYTYHGIIPAPHIDGYRNKMELTFGDEEKGGKLALGMRKRNQFYETLTLRHCQIINEDFKKILLATLAFFHQTNETFYHRVTHKGALRNLLIRKGEFSNELLINLVTTSTLTTDLSPLVDTLSTLNSEVQIAGILHTVNDSISDAVKCDHYRILYGKNHFAEQLLGLSFKISPFSFFQTNSSGAEKLYETVREFAGKADTIFDLYCGTGTIAQILAEHAQSVIGIELSEEAVVAACENAEQNGIANCRFLQGDVLKVIDNVTEQPEVIILDPPREGIHPKAIRKIIAFRAKKVVYVSCKPTSLVKDLPVFIENGYIIRDVRCHDMFPRTYHVETVVLLERSL